MATRSMRAPKRPLPMTGICLGLAYSIHTRVKSVGSTTSHGYGFRIERGSMFWASQGISNVEAAHEIARAVIKGEYDTSSPEN